MISKKYITAIGIIIAIPLFIFIFSPTIADKVNKYINIFANIDIFNSAVKLTERNKGVFDILKNGQYDFELSGMLDNVKDKNMAKYFKGNPPKTAGQNQNNAVSRVTPAKKKSASSYFNVSFIYYGDKESYAVINGELIKEGGLTRNGAKVLEIKPNKIKLMTSGGVKWFNLNI